MSDLEEYNLIFQEFCEWIAGIEEDDPLPPEIKYIFFVFSNSRGMNVLQYAGCEYKPKKICSFDYIPLEAQFFYSRNYLKLSCEQAKHFAQIFTKDILHIDFFEKLFTNKTVRFVEE